MCTYNCSSTVWWNKSKPLFYKLEIRSMEGGRPICPIAVLYFAVNVLSLTLKTLLVNKGTNVSTCWVTWHHRSRDHKTRSWWFPIGGPLTPIQYLARFPRYCQKNQNLFNKWTTRPQILRGHDLDRLESREWRHRSCDHNTRSGWFPIGVQRQ